MKKWTCLCITALMLLCACASSKSGKRTKTPRRIVPIAINIKTNNNADLNFINLDYYRWHLLDELKRFLPVTLELVEPDEHPELTLNLNIEQFILWPRQEDISRQYIRRVVQTGTDNNGKPVYQTVTASVDVIRVSRRSNARFAATLNFGGTPAKIFKRSFASSYNYSNTFVDNIMGDPRAIDPSLYFYRDSGMEPRDDDFLLALSRQDMIQRLSAELRAYYK